MGTRRITVKLGAVIALTASSLFFLQPAAHGRVRLHTLVPGVTYQAYSISGPNKIKLLTIAHGSGATLDVALAKNSLPGWAQTSQMATAHGAIAAVNGDFGLSPGRPAHLFAEDGNLVNTSTLGDSGKNFAVSTDKAGAYIGGPNVQITVTELSSRKSFTVDHWNEGDPQAAELSGFSPSGGSLERPGNGCEARLLPTAASTWGANQMSVQRDYTVDAVACGGSLSVGTGVVIQGNSGTPRGDQVKALVRGEAVRLNWSLGWRDVQDAIGGSPVLIDNGKIVVTNCGSYLCSRNPRTAVGIKKNGDILIMVVDGRSSVSEGMTLLALAKQMQAKGAVYAMNMDGGGSSTMWIKGKGVVNNPSDGSERYVSSALVVLPGADAGEGSGLKAPVATATDDQASADAAMADFQAAVQDPASIGGLLDYEASHGSTHAPVTTDPDLQALLDEFRAAQT